MLQDFPPAQFQLDFYFIPQFDWMKSNTPLLRYCNNENNIWDNAFKNRPSKFNDPTNGSIQWFNL